MDAGLMPAPLRGPAMAPLASPLPPGRLQPEPGLVSARPATSPAAAVRVAGDSTALGALALAAVGLAARLCGRPRSVCLRGRCSRCRNSIRLFASHRGSPRDPFSQGIRRAELIGRSFYLSQCPPEDPNLPEIAVFGRSNVGKSSLINFMTGRKMLSTTSKHPGHTKLCHHFLIDDSWYLVDLPGIGYAEGSLKTLKSMDRIVNAYVRHRSTLIELLYLVDASVPPTTIDVHGIKWLVDAGVYLSLVFTKTDNRPRGRLHREGPAEALTQALWDMEGSPWRLGIKREMPVMHYTSSVQKTGRKELMEHINDLRQRARPRVRATKAKSSDPQPVPKGAVEVNMNAQVGAPPPGIR